MIIGVAVRGGGGAKPLRGRPYPPAGLVPLRDKNASQPSRRRAHRRKVNIRRTDQDACAQYVGKVSAAECVLPSVPRRVSSSDRCRFRRLAILDRLRSLHFQVRLAFLGLGRRTIHGRRRRRQLWQFGQRRQLRRECLERRVGPRRDDPTGLRQLPIEFALLQLLDLGKDDPGYLPPPSLTSVKKR